MNYKEKLLDESQPIVVAIDGVSASGKGTLAKIMSKKFKLKYCPTSLFYRQLAYDLIQQEIQHDRAKTIEFSKRDVKIEKEADLYSSEVTDITSKIAAIPEVRHNLLKPQRDFLKMHKRVVMEGRDIGTVIAPEADLKIFITADLDVRANRRYNQIINNGGEVDLEEIRNALIERDERDSNRDAAPLLKADDAIEVDNSFQSPEEVVEFLVINVD